MTVNSVKSSRKSHRWDPLNDNPPNALGTRYRHADWEWRRVLLRFLLKTIGFTLLAKLDRVEGLENIPREGPAILMINHIALIDPIVVLHTLPRNIIPLAKIEVYNLPLIGILPKLWGVIPVRREEVDRRAIQQVLDVLAAGEIILVAPEGTRSPQLSQGKEGIAYIAIRSQAPIIPVAIEGTPGFPSFRFSKRWAEPGARVKFGRPFHFRSETGGRNSRELLRQMTDEAMYILAAMLPARQRGYYHNLAKATQDTIEWL